MLVYLLYSWRLTSDDHVPTPDDNVPTPDDNQGHLGHAEEIITGNLMQCISSVSI